MRRSVGFGAILALALAGCSASSDGVGFAQLEHVHGVATDGEQFFLASHHGLYEFSDGSWHLRGEEFDVMVSSTRAGILAPRKNCLTPSESSCPVITAGPGFPIL